MKPILPKEKEIQIAYFDWVKMMQLQNPRYKAIAMIPNGTHLANGAIGFKSLEKQGFRKGYPDVILPFCFTKELIHTREDKTQKLFTKRFNGAFIEFKRNEKKAKQSAEQMEYERILTAENYDYLLLRTTEEAMRITQEVINGYVSFFNG